MKLARIITIAMALAFSAGVVLTSWTPVNAEDTGGKTTKDKDKKGKAKTNKKTATTKGNKTTEPAKQDKQGY